MNDIKNFIDDICNPPFVPYGHIEDGVLKDIVVLCDLIGLKQTVTGHVIYTFKTPSNDCFEMDAFEFKSMMARYKELMEENA